MEVNKTHLAGTGVAAGFFALGVNLFFPHWHLTPDQMGFLTGVLPTAAMAVLIAVETVFPKVGATVQKIETAEENGGVPPLPPVAKPVV